MSDYRSTPAAPAANVVGLVGVTCSDCLAKGYSKDEATYTLLEKLSDGRMRFQRQVRCRCRREVDAQGREIMGLAPDEEFPPFNDPRYATRYKVWLDQQVQGRRRLAVLSRSGSLEEMRSADTIPAREPGDEDDVTP